MKDILLPRALIPSAEEKTGQVGVVIEVVVREEEVINLRRPQVHLDKFVGRGRTAVKQQKFPAELQHVCGAES